MRMLQKSHTRCQNKQTIYVQRDEFIEDIPEHVEHVGDTYFHRAQEVARKAYGVHSNTMKIVCIADLNSATGVACYVHAQTPLAAQNATRKLNA
jgi:hypothetical protein